MLVIFLEQKGVDKTLILIAAFLLVALGIFIGGRDPYNSGLFLVLGGFIGGMGCVWGE